MARSDEKPNHDLLTRIGRFIQLVGFPSAVAIFLLWQQYTVMTDLGKALHQVSSSLQRVEELLKLMVR